jgi:DNA-binding response OmpR family regulator
MPRVLVIEDDALVRKLLERRLQVAGWTVASLADGRELQQALETQRPDLLLIDMGLPYGNGLTLVQKIRAQGISTPILILTAYELPRLYEMVRGIGADDLMLKPYDQEDLLVRMQRMLAA